MQACNISCRHSVRLLIRVFDESAACLHRSLMTQVKTRQCRASKHERCRAFYSTVLRSLHCLWMTCAVSDIRSVPDISCLCRCRAPSYMIYLIPAAYAFAGYHTTCNLDSIIAWSSLCCSGFHCLSHPVDADCVIAEIICWFPADAVLQIRWRCSSNI